MPRKTQGSAHKRRGSYAQTFNLPVCSLLAACLAMKLRIIDHLSSTICKVFAADERQMNDGLSIG